MIDVVRCRSLSSVVDPSSSESWSARRCHCFGNVSLSSVVCFLRWCPLSVLSGVISCRVVVSPLVFCPYGRRRVVVTSLAVTVNEVLRSAGVLLVICSEVLRDICCRQLRLLCVLSSGLLVVANGAVQACAVEGLCIASRVRLPAAVARQCACCNWFWSSL